MCLTISTLVVHFCNDNTRSDEVFSFSQVCDGFCCEYNRPAGNEENQELNQAHPAGIAPFS
jgi:hypothetical protein